MSGVQAIGIDLGTTYSCLSYLTKRGEPITLPNAEGELSTPSVVLFDGGEFVVGTEALRNAIAQPERVVQNVKRFMGDPHKCWVIDGKVYRPSDISAFVLRKLLDSAEDHLGPIKHAVVTVPAQFSDIQRQDTIEAAHKAGLDRVDLINEPVAAALCHVLGTEGIWFSELAGRQKVMVYDLGGGTFDLSLVSYSKNAVNVVASAGDLHLGGIDWNAELEKFACEQFVKRIAADPRLDRHSMQALANDVEQCKRSLSARPRASVSVVHAGRHKTYPVSQELFESLTSHLVQRTEEITIEMVRQHALQVRGHRAPNKGSDSYAQDRGGLTFADRPGWQEIDAVLTTGGASRMPMIRKMLQRISGTTLNTSLSPEQSISHGASYYAGMLLSNQKFARTILASDVAARLAKVRQRSVNARALGVLVRSKQTGQRVPHYMLPANTPLPCEFRQTYGTVIENQKRVELHIVESGTAAGDAPVSLGACAIEDLPPSLPAASPIEVTISYDQQARVHVAAKDVASGKTAKTEIIRQENLVQTHQPPQASDIALVDAADGAGTRASDAGAKQHRLQSTSVPPTASQATRTRTPARQTPSPGRPLRSARTIKQSTSQPVPVSLETAERPVPLCNRCGEPLNARGLCRQCGAVGKRRSRRPRRGAKSKTPSQATASATRKKGTGQGSQTVPPAQDAQIVDLEIFAAKTEAMEPSAKAPARQPSDKKSANTTQDGDAVKASEDEFWDVAD